MSDECKREIGKIERIEPYGLYVKTGKGLALVLIPDIRLERISDLNDLFALGDEVEVRLLHYVEERDIYKATMLSG